MKDNAQNEKKPLIAVDLQRGVRQKQVYSFWAYNMEWDCVYVRDGERLDEAAYESAFSRRVKVKCFKIIDKQQKLWREFTGKEGCGVIFADDCCTA